MCKNYNITETTCHELAHSMHFNNVGKSYWNKYILGIIQCYARTGETYGNNKPSDSDYNGHIGVGETWGYAMGYYHLPVRLPYLQDHVIRHHCVGEDEKNE